MLGLMIATVQAQTNHFAGTSAGATVENFSFQYSIDNTRIDNLKGQLDKSSEVLKAMDEGSRCMALSMRQAFEKNKTDVVKKLTEIRAQVLAMFETVAPFCSKDGVDLIYGKREAFWDGLFTCNPSDKLADGWDGCLNSMPNILKRGDATATCQDYKKYGHDDISFQFDAHYHYTGAQARPNYDFTFGDKTRTMVLYMVFKGADGKEMKLPVSGMVGENFKSSHIDGIGAISTGIGNCSFSDSDVAKFLGRIVSGLKEHNKRLKSMAANKMQSQKAAEREKAEQAEDLKKQAKELSN